MVELTLQTRVTCPNCGQGAMATMPTNACVQRWPCPSCGTELRPGPGDCCVFCTYGQDLCPPEQEDRAKDAQDTMQGGGS